MALVFCLTLSPLFVLLVVCHMYNLNVPYSLEYILIIMVVLISFVYTCDIVGSGELLSSMPNLQPSLLLQE